MLGVPTAADCRAWARVSTDAVPDADMEAIRAAELAIQAETCLIPDDPDAAGQEATYPAALARALLRRVQRQCAVRNIALGFVTDAAAEFPPVQLSGWDAEVARLESSYRQHVVA